MCRIHDYRYLCNHKIHLEQFTNLQNKKFFSAKKIFSLKNHDFFPSADQSHVFPAYIVVVHRRGRRNPSREIGKHVIFFSAPHEWKGKKMLCCVEYKQSSTLWELGFFMLTEMDFFPFYAQFLFHSWVFPQRECASENFPPKHILMEPHLRRSEIKDWIVRSVALDCNLNRYSVTRLVHPEGLHSQHNNNHTS